MARRNLGEAVMNPTLSNVQTLAIFGATGGIGLALTRQALTAGRQVRALVRNPAKLHDLVADLGPNALGRLHVEQGDVTVTADAARTVAGSDAVLVALGAPPFSGSTVRSDGTATVVSAMKTEGARRIVAVSVFGAHETRRQLPFFLRYVIFPFYLAQPVREHERQERILAESGLDWTAVRPPNLTDEAAEHGITHGFTDAREATMYIGREEVAAFMLEEIEARRYVGATPAIAQRPAPRNRTEARAA